MDKAGTQKDAATRHGIGMPRRYDGGTVVIPIFSEYDLAAGFLPADAGDPVSD